MYACLCTIHMYVTCCTKLAPQTWMKYILLTLRGQYIQFCFDTFLRKMKVVR